MSSNTKPERTTDELPPKRSGRAPGGPIPTIKKAALLAAFAVLSEPRPDERRYRVEPDPVSRPICEYCGGFIEETDQRCAALDDGVCAP